MKTFGNASLLVFYVAMVTFCLLFFTAGQWSLEYTDMCHTEQDKGLYIHWSFQYLP